MIINITGIDGCGKTTQVDLLSQGLRAIGREVFVSKAFGYSDKAVYTELLPQFDPVALMFLFQALHVQQRVAALKAEKDGRIVISDRWDDSYLAYHRKFGLLSEKESLRTELNKLAFGSRKADLTFLLDLPPEQAGERMGRRGKSFLDSHPISHFEIIRNSFLELAQEENWVVLNGAEGSSGISSQIFSRVKALLP